MGRWAKNRTFRAEDVETAPLTVVANQIRPLGQKPNLPSPMTSTIPKTAPGPTDQLPPANSLVPDQQSEQAQDAELGSLEPFHVAVVVIRLGITLSCIALAANELSGSNLKLAFWLGLIGASSLLRTIKPLRDLDSYHTFGRLSVEFGIHVLAILTTGYWESPLVLSLVISTAVASLARGAALGIRTSGAATIAITVAGYSSAWQASDSQIAVQWALFLMLVSIVCGYVRNLSWDANAQYSATLEQVSDLTEANALLFNLHRIAQLLPASLDLEETLDSTEAKLSALVDYESSALLLRDETDGHWIVARRQALKLPTTIDYRELPDHVRRAIESGQPTLVSNLRGQTHSEGGLGDQSASALYVPLTARGSLVGLLALEHPDQGAFGQRDLDILKAMAEPVALAIDNARWFRKLRALGANEERSRIARDLHDRIGQSLAYLAFEIDRIVHQDERGEPVGSGLNSLRVDLRTVIGEVRDTLYDLRSDVATEKDLASTITEFAERVAERSQLVIDLDLERNTRLPIRQEREIWRITQEALINVERHADANNVTVTWTFDGPQAVLEISDNGRGLPVGHKGRIDSYGILGMRERASSIGASLEISSHPGEGTTVRCCLIQD